MAVPRCVSVCGSLLCLLLVFASNIAPASSDGREDVTTSSFTCNQVRELFEGDFGAPAALHAHPEQEADKSLCRHAREKEGSIHHTCCSAETEEKFAQVAEKRLKENVRTRNHALKKHLTNLLAKYQDRIAQLMGEAQNRTSVFLTRLHKIPWSEHETIVGEFFTTLHRIVSSASVDTADPPLDEALRDFFTNLFPAVFNYVLTVQGKEERQPISADYHACLKRYADQIQPFGNQPDVILRHLRHAVKHASVFQDGLKTFTDAMTSTEAVSMDTSCRHALLRLQVCGGCRGVSVKGSQKKPCRGMCLNIMRGCLAKMSEISSSWDDLVVSFENVQVGMMGRHELQKLLMYIDMNVSEAIMMAMDDIPRIYDEVKVKCQTPPHHEAGGSGNASRSSPLPLMPPDLTSEAIPTRNVQSLRAFQQEVRSMVKYLDDSKGMFNRLPDSLCQDPARYSQDMQSNTCWNGTAVGRYMEQVPEANFLSQVQHNKEVKVTLMDPDFEFLLVKESLTHMRRNLSSLLNTEIMLGDGPVYKNVAGGVEDGGQEGSGSLRRVIVDDEDLVAYGSGSGSGSGDGGEDGDGETTPKPTDPRGPSRPTSRPPTQPSSSHTATTSTLLLLLCVLSQRLFSLLQ